MALNAVTPAQLLAYTVPDSATVDRAVVIDTFRSVTARMRSQEAAKGNLTKVGLGKMAHWRTGLSDMALDSVPRRSNIGQVSRSAAARRLRTRL
jgi:hypothetical protein